MQDKKELILEAALSLFSDGTNIGSIKVSDIAKKAGVGKGTVYEYFESKDEIFAQSVIHFTNKQKLIFINSIGEGDFKTEFFNIMNCINSIIASNRPLFGMILLSSHTYKLNTEYEEMIKSEVRKIQIEVVEILSKCIKKGQIEGIISDKITQKDVTFAFLSIGCVLNHYDAMKDNCLREGMTYAEMVEFCFEKLLKLLN